jgi:hypothetical protein
MDNQQAHRIAKRVVFEMVKISEHAPQDEQRQRMQFFMGLGISLAFCFEEITGKSARSEKPLDLMKWALALPLPADRLVQ